MSEGGGTETTTPFARATVVVLAKAPILGTVKTRLAGTIGAHEVLILYRRLLARTVAGVRDPRWDTVLAVSPDETACDDALWPPLPRRMAQGTGDLGARMLRPLARAANDAPVLVVGSDIPGLSARQIAAAFRALEVAPFVFGPALDGGFYLVGAREAPPGTLFDGVEWSAPTTLRSVVGNLPPGRHATIETLDDLDDEAALERHRAAGTL
ncbi:TIGR04282 family arsenosugar biosynthesis glycosyltransferase [Fulvimarina sp. 2208YS6-2-32]|uniref:TIGR04282 family arsenosugar biosynthesis glycosyltransferase n=1 Tax=Fulvimarina uroteuthidis TaxID=3098149 RepID=A0ABU5HZJ0_9HYPH|nr:TIGR04282 family arsenosugar biosynthesis glycosyltransferase [Fulvimarina sp. 2208YS6-2-32]MDY8108544.1 TIGR04282 family arsenosugar biosynthesis glycosyltransferase [Fulvimarina sp. 2208YS6-2-32]